MPAEKPILSEYEILCTAAQAEELDVFGAFETQPKERACLGHVLILFGPHHPERPPDAPEFQDGAPDPLDRWSRRIIDMLAIQFEAQAFYPFGGPPFHPFIDWALRSRRAFSSPTGLMVHDRAGLMLSYRGALGLPRRIDLPEPINISPCCDCAAPCRDACPVGALSAGGTPYDAAACRDHIVTPQGCDCLERGCRVRNACPLSQRYGLAPERASLHMRAFVAAKPS